MTTAHIELADALGFLCAIHPMAAPPIAWHPSGPKWDGVEARIGVCLIRLVNDEWVVWETHDVAGDALPEESSLDGFPAAADAVILATVTTLTRKLEAAFDAKHPQLPAEAATEA